MTDEERRERHRGYRRKYYWAHREEILAKSKEEYRRFREENPELAKKIYCDYAHRHYVKKKEKKNNAAEEHSR